MRPLDTQPGYGRLQIDVEDTGIGIAAEKLETIFEQFAQSERARRSRSF